MGKLITIVGNSGVGKTTLAKKLSEAGKFQLLLEDNLQRPFQKQFDGDLSGYALANQVDFLLFRGEQEIHVREQDVVAVQDGGLDLDFHVFTKRFQQNGYLTDDEFGLCERLYNLLRKSLPGPDLYIMLTAPTGVMADRMAKRKREIDIAKREDLLAMDRLLEEWAGTIDAARMMTIDASEDDPNYTHTVIRALSEIEARFKP